MTKAAKSKKLGLSVETIRALDACQLANAHGGYKYKLGSTRGAKTSTTMSCNHHGLHCVRNQSFMYIARGYFDFAGDADRDPEPEQCNDFLAQAGSFLGEREAEHNLILGLCSTIVDHPEVYPEARFAVALDGNRVAGAAIQTPPHNVILSEMTPESAVAFADALADTADVVPGVLGSTDVVRAVVERWRERTGAVAALELSTRIFRIDRVTVPRPAAGAWRLAAPSDRPTRVWGWS